MQTVTDLKAGITAYLARSDLTGHYDDWIAACENRVAYGSPARQPFPSEPVRVPQMEQRRTLTIDAQEVDAPDGLLQPQRIILETDPVAFVDFLSPEAFWTSHAGTEAGRPESFTIEGRKLLFGPSPDATYTGRLLGVFRFPALGPRQQTNWLLLAAHQVYLFGCLLEGALRLRDTAQATVWHGAFAGAVAGVNDGGRRAKTTGAALVMRPVGMATP